MCKQKLLAKPKPLLISFPRKPETVKWRLLIYQALKEVEVYTMLYPTVAEGRRLAWDNDGMSLVDFIPKEEIASTNSQEMQIRLKNGSIINVKGADNKELNNV